MRLLLKSKNRLLQILCIFWIHFAVCQVVTWNSDESVTVVGEEIFIFKTSYKKEIKDYQYSFEEVANLRKSSQYGLQVDGVLSPVSIGDPVLEFPDNDGVTLEMYTFDFKANEPLPIAHYSVYTTENNKYTYKEGSLIMPPHRRRLDGDQEVIYSNNNRKLWPLEMNGFDFYQERVRKQVENHIPNSYSLLNKYAVYIKVKVKNATLYKMNIPGIGEVTPERMFKDNTGNEVATLKTIFNDPNGYNYTFVAAHRGYWSEAGVPENTIKAFERAFAVGSDMIEIDVRLTSDNVPVACHDDFIFNLYEIPQSLLTKYNVAKKEQLLINHITAEDFKSLETKDRFGTVIPNSYPNTIAEVLNRFPNHLIALDLKPTGDPWKLSFKECLKLVKDKGISQNVIIKSAPKMTVQAALNLLNEFNSEYTVDGFNGKLPLTFYDFIFTPVIYTNTNADGNFDGIKNSGYQEWVDYCNQPNTNCIDGKSPINAAEVIFKYNGDPLLALEYPKKFYEKNIRVGTYNFYSDAPLGVRVVEKTPISIPLEGFLNLRQYHPDINNPVPVPNISPPSDGMLDNRGHVEWNIKNGGVNYIIYDRPDMLIKQLKAYGKRSVIPISQ